MTAKKTTKPKQDVLIVLTDCEAGGTKYKQGDTFTGSDIINLSRILNNRHFKVVKQ